MSGDSYSIRPVVDSLGLMRKGAGWCVVLLRTQDRTVLSTKILTEPDLFLVATEAFRIEAAKRILNPQ